MQAGSLPASELTGFICSVHKKVSSQQEKKKSDPDMKGLQRTSAFIHSVITSVLHARNAAASSADAPLLLPRGGFTDVGIHTGHAAARDTCWPLVREVLKVREAVKACHALTP
jgi:hypothetical protein